MTRAEGARPEDPPSDPDPGSPAFLEGQQAVLERAARGASLHELLEAIVALVESEDPTMTCSILLLDAERRVMRDGAGPRLPASYRAAIDGAPIGPVAGSCGTAAYRGEVVVVEDIASDPLWAAYKDLAQAAGLRACWSSPVFGAASEVLGTFAMYYRDPRAPSAPERARVAAATHLAAIVIEQDRARRALAASGAELRAVFDQAAVGMLLAGPGPGRVRVNGALARMLGLEVGAYGIADLDLDALGHPDDREVDRAQHQDLLAGRRESYQVEKRLRRADGTSFWARLTVSAVRSDGALGLLVWMVEDITQRKQLEGQMLRAQRIDSLAAFASGLAHDFNNILTAITGSARVALDELDGAHAAVEALHDIERAAARATDLVRRILAFSRDGEPTRIVQPLEPLLRQAEGLLRASVPPSIVVQVAVAPDVGPVRADAAQLHQVVMNLAQNAVQAMPDGGVLELALDRQVVAAGATGPAAASGTIAPGAWVRLVVRDGGAGIDDATRARLFEPFFTTRAPGQGAGLGLAMVMTIVRAHDGHVRVESALGRGSAFEVWLPAAAAAVTSTTTRPSARALGRGERVLFVDDEPVIGRLARRELEHAGFRATIFDDPQQALAAFVAAPDAFDAIVSDASMPRLTGFDIAREVRRLRPDIAFVLISGGLWNRDAADVRALGIDDFLLKPSALRELPLTLRRVLDT